MTSRERFRCALNHEEGDRVPIDLGSDVHNGIHEKAYRRLLEHLGMVDEITLYDRIQHLAVMKQEVKDRLHADTAYIFANNSSTYELKEERYERLRTYHGGH